MRRVAVFSLLLLAVLASSIFVSGAVSQKIIGVNLLLNTEITRPMLVLLGALGNVRDVVYEINAVTMQIRESDLDSIRALPFVAAANPDSVRNGAPIDAVPATDFATGYVSWNLDAIDVPQIASEPVIYDGNGVYVAVIDTGLVDSWRQYFPQERIAEEYGIAFGGGGGDMGFVSSQPEKWEHDQNSHGTHVTSTVLGYQRTAAGLAFTGVAPRATVIPVKVLNQNGSGWSSVIARGVTYVADLKAGPLKDHPVVINMSLGGPRLDAMEKAAIDYAIENGVIVVASAGNYAEAGMGYPGAYEPVISVAASGWTGEWQGQRTDPGRASYYQYWWYLHDVSDPVDPDDFYITDFSSREKPGQQLDVAAPGSWVLGPYQDNSGQLSYYFLGGTSMASPHVAGIAALMVQKNPSLSQMQAESIIRGSAILLPAGCRNVLNPSGAILEYCWGSDATGAGLANASDALSETPDPIKVSHRPRVK